MRACGPGEFRASLEAQLLMVARRLSHRVVAIGHFPPVAIAGIPPTVRINSPGPSCGEERFLASVRLMVGFLHIRARAQ